MHPEFTLEKRIEAQIVSYDGQMSVYADDLKGNIIEIGADEKFETASTVKVFILACLFEQVEAGKADLDELITYKKEHYVNGSGLLRSLSVGTTLKVRDVATLMIIVSDNIATNMMIDYLGIDTINACIKSLGCPNSVLHNPIDFEKYDKLGTTTPREYASMFVRISRGELISEKASAQMKEILKQQHYNTTLTKYFPQYYLDEDMDGEELLYVASKSGSMRACRNDGGIVHTPYGEYVIVIMNKNFHDPLEHNEHAAQVYGAEVSRMILDQYLALEGRFVL